MPRAPSFGLVIKNMVDNVETQENGSLIHPGSHWLRDWFPASSSDHGCWSAFGKAGASGSGFPVDLLLPML